MTFSKSQHAYFCCQSELHTLCPTVSSRAVFGTFMSCLTSSLRLGDPRPRKTLIKVPQSDHGMGPPLEPDKNFRMPNESVQAYCSNPFFITITFFVPYKRAGTHFPTQSRQVTNATPPNQPNLPTFQPAKPLKTCILNTLKTQLKTVLLSTV